MSFTILIHKLNSPDVNWLDPMQKQYIANHSMTVTYGNVRQKADW